MSIKRFIARTSRDALKLVREELGEDAVIMATQPCPQGVELVAMSAESAQEWHSRWASAPAISASTAPAAPVQTVEAAPADDGMSTLSFQDYVRERMLRRRAAQAKAAQEEAQTRARAQDQARYAPAATQAAPLRTVDDPAFPAAAAELVAALAAAEAQVQAQAPLQNPLQAAAPVQRPAAKPAPQPAAARTFSAASEIPPAQPAFSAAAADASPQAQRAVMRELGSMKQLIEDRFETLAFLERLRCQPHQGEFTRRMMERGFSSPLVRAMVEAMPADLDSDSVDRWASAQLLQHLLTGWDDAPLEDDGGIYAMIGSTGVGKTTTTAKLAAAFAMKHGTAGLGLITLDAYRLGAQEQLRAYGRILGVPVHTAHDRSSLEDLLTLLSGKRMVLIDTAGMAQRDHRTRELLDMVTRPDIRHVLVLNASAQGDTLEDVTVAYSGHSCHGVILSKVDETLKLGPALDVALRHRLRVVGVANGQRVPEDWHRLSPQALVQRAMSTVSAPAFRFGERDATIAFMPPPARQGRPGVALHG
ncbi:flagellar biosynthesis protein FlhF [Amphibiibacter pelophylacis]|uniref:Flagellar biosynthesis protein FlhF n=1 Tax=Amphibiibacter pelophylacis TaxID=1799477 RepID=A0ACC6NZW0_9BURK